MNNIYNENFQEYYDKSMPVVPVNGKIPLPTGWASGSYEKEFVNGSGIGLITGERSDVICLDLDVEDEWLKGEIEKIIEENNPSPVMRFGNKNKPAARFYCLTSTFSRKDLISTRDIKDRIELLSTGQQVVLPPSMHPDFGYPYEWASYSLKDFDIEHLPSLKIETWELLREAFNKKYPNNNTVSTTYGGKGRHSDLVDIAGAIIGRNEKHDSAVDELIKYDNENHETPYFTDVTEPHGGKGYIAASKMFSSLLDTHIRNGGTYNPSAQVIIGELQIKEKRKRKKFPKLEGIAQDMFEHVYNNSTKQRTRFSMASALSAMSICIGNKIRYDNIHPNLYALIVADSGEGKDTPLKFPKQCLIQSDLKHLIGQSQPASDSGIIGPLTMQPKRLDTIDEADILFSSINSKNNVSSSKMADVYAMLYTSCGTYFEGKVTARSKFKKEGECENPYISMFCAMTPEAFRESMTTRTINKGLGARFLYFIDEERKRNKIVRNRKEKIPENIKEFFKMWNSTDDYNLSGDIKQIQASSKVIRQLELVNEMYEDFKHSVSTDSKMRPIYNRAFETMVKLAIIYAASTDSKTTNIELTTKGIDWSNRFMEVYFDNMKDFIENNVASNNIDRMNNLIIDALDKSKCGLTKSEIYKKTRSLSAQERNSILKELVMIGDVTEYKNKNENNTQTVSRFILTKHIKIDNV